MTLRTALLSTKFMLENCVIKVKKIKYKPQILSVYFLLDCIHNYPEAYLASMDHRLDTSDNKINDTKDTLSIAGLEHLLRSTSDSVRYGKLDIQETIRLAH